MAGMGLKSKYQAILPGGIDIFSNFDHPSGGGIPIPQRVMKSARQGAEIFVQGQRGRELAAEDEHFGAGADGGANGLNERLAGAGLGQRLLAQLNLTWSGEVKRLVHALLF